MADDLEERKRLFERTKDELTAAMRSNAEQFDRAVLTLSTGFLALSISFMKDVVPFAEMANAWLLYLSWIAFALAIAHTVFGLIYGQRVQKRLITAAEDYYIKGLTEAWTLSESLPAKVDKINWAVGVLFTLGVALTVTFVIVNLAGREMTEKRKTIPDRVERAQPATPFQKLPVSPAHTSPAPPPPKPEGSPSTPEIPADK